MTPLLQVEQLGRRFPLGQGRSLDALCDVSFSIAPGETLGVVGESGCGKSTLARVIMGAERPTAGRVLYRGQPLALSTHKARRDFSRKAQMVFQDPYASLDPRMTVEAIVAEGLEVHRLLDAAGRRARVLELLELVGLSAEHAGRFPHEFSGGQRQRVGIARALAVGPEFLVCDEPVSALDLSVQSQVMNLLRRLRDELGLTLLFIAHDLGLVRFLCDRVAVLYLGRLVELADAADLCDDPRHPYTQLLLDAVLSADPADRRLDRAEMADDRAAAPPSVGCVFADRCRQAEPLCRAEAPLLRPVGPGRLAACHRLAER